MAVLYKEYIENIINTRGQYNVPADVKEEHHIVPRCKGGKGNRKQKHPNIIWLYPHEHFMAHKLLMDENPGDRQLAYAFIMMSVDRLDRRKYNEWEYEEIAIARKKYNTGINNPCYGKKPWNYGKHYSIPKMSESIKKCNLTGDRNGNSRKVYCEETGETYCCVRECLERMGISHGKFYKCIKIHEHGLYYV